FRKVPADRPDELVRLRWAGKNDMVTSQSEYGFSASEPGNVNVSTTFSYRIYEQLRAGNKTMIDILACAPFGNVNVVANNQADVASSIIVSGNYFQVLGIKAFAGRPITPDDDKPAAPPVAVISHAFWLKRFGGDRGAVG